MPFSINIRCDNASARRIRELWSQCGRLEARPSMESLGYPPHFTLAVFDHVGEAELVAAVDGVGSAGSCIPVQFDRIGVFETPDAIVLWAAPSDPAPLTALHHRVHEQIDSPACRAHYRPGAWVPHCSLATAIDKEHRGAATAMVRAGIEPFRVLFDVLDCARFHPVQVLHEQRLLPDPTSMTPDSSTMTVVDRRQK